VKPAVGMTLEDLDAWGDVCARTSWEIALRALEDDRRDAELMLSVSLYPHMYGTMLAQGMNPNFKMPRPLARIAPRFFGRADATS
jgi:hypothetical protein